MKENRMAKIEMRLKGILEEYYIDFEGNRYWFSNARKRTTFWRCAENSKELKVIMYPAWSFINNYINKEIKVEVVK